MNNNLIFDFGFHNGDDSDFYLRKGYNIVAIEANPELVNKGIMHSQQRSPEESPRSLCQKANSSVTSCLLRKLPNI